MNVTHEDMAVVFVGKLIALINTNTAVRGHVMFVIDDRWKQFVGVRISGNATLPRVNPSGRHVKKMIDHAGAYERIAAAIEIDTPRVARAIGKHFELLRARMITRDRGGDLDPGSGGFGILTRE